MIPRRNSSTRSRAQAAAATDRELLRASESCWRMSQELQALRETLAVFRAGANSLAIDNTTLKIENEHLRRCALTASWRER
jgi:regulator of replication initiation timing